MPSSQLSRGAWVSGLSGNVRSMSGGVVSGVVSDLCCPICCPGTYPICSIVVRGMSVSRNTEKSTFLYERIRLWDPGGLQGMCLYMLKTPRIIPLGSGRPELCSVKVRTFFEKRPTSNYGVAIRFLGRTAASGAHLGLYGLGTYHMLSM